MNRKEVGKRPACPRRRRRPPIILLALARSPGRRDACPPRTRSAECPAPQRVGRGHLPGIILGRIGMPGRCGLGQAALRRLEGATAYFLSDNFAREVKVEGTCSLLNFIRLSGGGSRRNLARPPNRRNAVGRRSSPARTP